MKYRTAAVSGQFYPESALQLRSEVNAFLTATTEEGIHTHALIVPHAGYCYSGGVAGCAYAYLKSIASHITRVILLGPSHRVALQGCAVSNYEAFATPLGLIDVASECYPPLLKLGLVSSCDSAHLLEHSLEVQLPFLQCCLDNFKIVPIVVGQNSPHTIKEILNVLKVDDGSTLVVVSSDLSHYHPYQQAKILDNNTIDKILNYDHTLTGEDACGCFSVNGLLDYAHSQRWKIKLIQKTNSGDILGSKKEVVGYASFILY
ncbi:MAG: AmmeMemoRadiSam system protein B [Psychromonas sp.]|jgi:AmmeMemoRadiSam system protein B|uniref:AmmeMemoRadiSam system protein B n=1 Tax=Psychromonas sp. TaxID=1884585 RepID=UPI0039E453ED